MSPKVYLTLNLPSCRHVTNAPQTLDLNVASRRVMFVQTSYLTVADKAQGGSKQTHSLEMIKHI